MTTKTQLPADFPIRLEIRIDWADTDFFGHVNNLAVMRYVQSARVLAIEESGLMQLHKEKNMAPILAQTSCRFVKQLFYPGAVVVCSRIDKIKTTSFQINHFIFDSAGEVAAEAQDVLVLVNFAQNAKTPIPALFREKLVELGGESVV